MNAGVILVLFWTSLSSSLLILTNSFVYRYIHICRWEKPSVHNDILPNAGREERWGRRRPFRTQHLQACSRCRFLILWLGYLPGTGRRKNVPHLTCPCQNSPHPRVASFAHSIGGKLNAPAGCCFDWMAPPSSLAPFSVRWAISHYVYYKQYSRDRKNSSIKRNHA